ncbi:MULTISPECIES: type II toxin-antitoxin system VapC family toxin [Derxia]|uniref:Ribonuclease VapC n=1 Tax=Derxia gummosa DSM 723 TaxID=1121388 RepID=A0A8B6X4S8_9BURK|nr:MULTISPECIES: type II toxin-antitoxin system VapC family toxin [Derxia]
MSDGHAFLLDTNILSALTRDPHGVVRDRLCAALPLTACTSIVVAAELRYGLSKGVSARLRERVEGLLASIDVLPFDAPADEHYGDIRATLQRLGQPIGLNDLLIAAHARALGLTLVTHNTREFERVPGLKVEDWLSTGAGG